MIFGFDYFATEYCPVMWGGNFGSFGLLCTIMVDLFSNFPGQPIDSSNGAAITTGCQEVGTLS